MASFSCKSLHTIYSCENRTISWNKSMGSAACYGGSLQMMGIPDGRVFDADYHIMLMTDPNYMYYNNGNNFCVFDMHFIYCYLRRINRVKAFRFKISEAKYNGYKGYRIDLSMKGTRPEFTFVLQSIKRLYEYPYCFYLLEAKRMQELPEFKFQSIFSLFNAVASYFDGFTSNTGHSYSLSSKCIPVRVIKEKLGKVAYAHQIYSAKYTEMQHSKSPDTEKWTQEEFMKRLPIYTKNLKYLSE